MQKVQDTLKVIMKLKVENQALMQLLKEEIKKRTSSHLETTFEVSSNRRVNPQAILQLAPSNPEAIVVEKANAIKKENPIEPAVVPAHE